MEYGYMTEDGRYITCTKEESEKYERDITKEFESLVIEYQNSYTNIPETNRGVLMILSDFDLSYVYINHIKEEIGYRCNDSVYGIAEWFGKKPEIIFWNRIFKRLKQMKEYKIQMERLRSFTTAKSYSKTITASDTIVIGETIHINQEK